MKRTRVVKGETQVLRGCKKLMRCSFCPRSEWRWLARKKICCKKCERAKGRASYLERKPIAKTDSGAYWRSHPEERRAYMAKWREKNRLKLRKYERNYWRKQAKKNREVAASVPCLECGAHHSLEMRLAILRRCADLSPTEIREAYPCLWGPPEDHGSYAARRFYLDRALLSEKQRAA